MRSALPITLLLALPLAFSVRGQGQPESLVSAWRDAVLLLYADAHQVFRTEVGVDPALRRERLVGEALTLLNLQPRTEANVSRARSILDGLQKDEAADEIGILSRYYLGRIAQIHNLTPDPEAAIRIFRNLLDDHPDHLFGQFAGVKWALVYLGTAPTPEIRLTRLTEIEGIVPLITLPGPAKDLHLFLADGSERYAGDLEQSLRHLIAAGDLGISKRNLRGDVFVRIGEIALALGQTEIALDYFQRFLAEFPRDLRTYTITRKVRELEAAP
ncbi:MAG: tetratricopeptide repeat protein [Opitutaceae bacterium]